MSNNKSSNPSSIALDPKMAAEHLGGFVSNSQAYNMDALGFQHLQPTTLAPGVVKKKYRQTQNDTVVSAPPRRVESPQEDEYVEDGNDYYEDGDNENEDYQETEEYDEEPPEDQSKGSSIASLESKYSRMNHDYQSSMNVAPEPVQAVERSAPPSSSVVSNVPAPFPRYTPKVRSTNYQDQYASNSNNLPGNSAPARGNQQSGASTKGSSAQPPASGPFPKWTPPASLKGFQDTSNQNPYSQGPQGSQDYSAVPQERSSQFNSAPPPAMGNGYAKYQSNQAMTPPQAVEEPPFQSQQQSHSKYHSNQVTPQAVEEPQHQTPLPQDIPDQQPAPYPADPYNVPGQAGYKWNPPALLKIFQDSDGAPQDQQSATPTPQQFVPPQPSVAPQQPQSQQQYAPSQQQQPQQHQFVPPQQQLAPQQQKVAQPTPQSLPPQQQQQQQAIPAPVPAQPQRARSLRPVSSEFLLWSKTKPFSMIMDRIETESLECDPNITTESGNTLFHVACEVGNIQLALYLLDKYGANNTLGKYNFAGFQPIHLAAQQGQIQIFIELSQHQNCQSFFQELTQRTQDNLYHLCVKNDQATLLSYLYSSGTLSRHELKRPNSQGLTPLHLACHYGLDGCFQLLLSLHEPDFLDPTQQQMTCLDLICSQGHLNLLRYLHTVYLPSSQSSVSTPLSLLQSLNPNGFTCLHTACQFQQYHVIDYLINAVKVNPDGVTGQRIKPSEVVATDLMQYLLYGRVKSSTPASTRVVSPGTPSQQTKSLESTTATVTPATVSSNANTLQSNAATPAPAAAVTATVIGGAIGVIETESQSLSQSPWSNVALRPASTTASGSGQDTKFKSKPYVPPTNVSFLPPKAVETSEEKLALSRERALNKMKTKKNDSWMKPKTEDSTAAATSPATPPMSSPEAPSPSRPQETIQSAPQQQTQSQPSLTQPPPTQEPQRSNSAGGAAKYSSIDMDSSSDEEDSDAEVEKEEQEQEEQEPEPEPEPISKFEELSAWLEQEEKLGDLEAYFGVGESQLKEDINAILDPTGTNGTLLHRACGSGRAGGGGGGSCGLINMVQCLVEGAGCHVNTVDAHGMTALHYAIRSSYSLIAKYLIKQCGADLTIQDENNLTPLDLCGKLLEASEGDQESLVEIRKVLEKYGNKSMEKRLKITQPVYIPSQQHQTEA